MIITVTAALAGLLLILLAAGLLVTAITVRAEDRRAHSITTPPNSPLAATVRRVAGVSVRAQDVPAHLHPPLARTTHTGRR